MSLFELDFVWYFCVLQDGLEPSTPGQAESVLYVQNNEVQDDYYLAKFPAAIQSPGEFTVHADVAGNFYSDDFGVSWKIGGHVPFLGGNECMITALPNFTLLMSFRTEV